MSPPSSPLPPRFYFFFGPLGHEATLLRMPTSRHHPLSLYEKKKSVATWQHLPHRITPPRPIVVLFLFFCNAVTSAQAACPVCLKSKLHKHGTTFFCECGLIPPCTHTHTHTHTHTQTNTHTHTRARAHTHTLTGMRLNVHGDQLTLQQLKENLVACLLSLSLSLSLTH
jgi:hypothetical protein